MDRPFPAVVPPVALVTLVQEEEARKSFIHLAVASMEPVVQKILDTAAEAPILNQLSQVKAALEL
jgi:hypothetical protein